MIASANRSVYFTIIFTAVFLALFFLPLFEVFAKNGNGGLFSPLVPCQGVNDCGFEQLIELIRRIINFLIFIAVPLAAIAFAYAGFLYLTSAGNTGKIQQAHTIFTDVFWGLIIALAAWLVVNTIAASLLNESIFGGKFWFLGD